MRSINAYLENYVGQLRRSGAFRDSFIEHALRTIERHHFLQRIHRRSGNVLLPDESGEWADEALEVIYADNTLVTNVNQQGVPISSSTSPSLMAFMLEKLGLRSDLRVLEIGTGTGYNAALMATITRCEVISVDSDPDVSRAARGALTKAGVNVHQVLGDGYYGYADRGPYDRIIATCRVAGVPPSWLDQLAPGGLIVAPVYQFGIDPLLIVRCEKGIGCYVRPTATAGYFMPAGGALHPPELAPPLARFPAPTISRRAAVPTYRDGYHDLWFHAGVRDCRIAAAQFDSVAVEDGLFALVEGESAAAIQSTGTIYGTGPSAAELLGGAAGIIGNWNLDGRPPARQFVAPLIPTCGLPDPLLIPDVWRRIQQ